MSSESRGGWKRSEDAVPFSDDMWKYRDMLIKTLRTHCERVKINEGRFQCYLLSELIDEHSCTAVIISNSFFFSIMNQTKTHNTCVIPINHIHTEASVSSVFSVA